MDFVAVLDQVIALLRQRGRVTYRTLKLQFTLDDEQLATLKDELLYSQPPGHRRCGARLGLDGRRCHIIASAPFLPARTPAGHARGGAAADTMAIVRPRPRKAKKLELAY